LVRLTVAGGELAEKSEGAVIDVDRNRKFLCLGYFERIRAVAFQSIERSFSFGCFIVQPPKSPHFSEANNYDGVTGGYTATRRPIQLV